MVEAGAARPLPMVPRQAALSRDRQTLTDAVRRARGRSDEAGKRARAGRESASALRAEARAGSQRARTAVVAAREGRALARSAYAPNLVKRSAFAITSGIRW